MDDFEVIHNPEVHTILKQVAANLSPSHHLVIATRQAPELGLARMRVRGQLLEVESDDLRFAWDETESFLRTDRGLDLADEELARLYRCTEGWAAALQLSALALTGSDDRRAVIDSFSGSFADIADYLAEDVVSRQPERVRDFLLKTSILDRLSVNLCATVTGYEDSYELLSHLERANLFLSPLDEERRWYRYHNLFAEFLRAQAERTMPHALPGLHERAADWLESEGLAVEAAKHALAAGDLDRAAGLMAQCAMTLVRIGQLRTVADWVDRLPSQTLDRHPELRIALCWAHSMRHEHEKAQEVLAQIVRGLESQEAADPAILDQVLALEPVVLSLTDRVDECLQLSERNLPMIADRESWAYGVLENCLACRLLEAGRFDEATALLDNAYQNHLRSGSVFGAMYSSCLKGALELLQGRLSVAVALYRDALARAGGGAMVSQTSAVAAVFLAEALFEMDEVDEAERLLAESRDRFRECVPLDVMLLGYLTLARVHALRGDDRTAADLLDEAEAVGYERGTPRASATAALERVRLAVGRGDLADAASLAARTEDDPVWRAFTGWGMPANDPETPAVSALRLLIRRGDAGRALPRLRTELARAEQTHHRRRALKLRILLAEALAETGEARAAARAMSEALVFGHREGFVRAFADEGPVVLALVEAAEHAAVPVEYRERILRAGTIGAPRSHRTHAHADDDLPAEPLTARETEVLQMVAAGFSNSELAARLFVTVPTVKFHLRNINTKLRASNRTRAVARARELGLLN